MLSKTITFSEAAEMLGCSRQYVHQLATKLDIRPYVVNKRLSLLGKSDVQKMKRYIAASRKE